MPKNTFKYPIIFENNNKSDTLLMTQNKNICMKDLTFNRRLNHKT